MSSRSVDSVDLKPSVNANSPPQSLHVPGALPSGRAANIPDWFKVGSNAFEDQTYKSDNGRHKAALTAFIKKQYYGEWYHDAAVITVAVVASHFITRFGLGWGWLLILLALCRSYYTISMSRIRQRMRDDILRELVKTRLETEYESADWLNSLLERLWLVYEPVFSRMIMFSANQILSINHSAFLRSFRLTALTLGTKAPRIEKVKTVSPRTGDDVVMDWEISFTPNDISGLKEKEFRHKVNPKFKISKRVGMGPASVSLPIILENVSFRGVLKARLKLKPTFPNVGDMDLSFAQKPLFDWELKAAGGETFGFDISLIPGLAAFVRDMVHSMLGPIMYEPSILSLDLGRIFTGQPFDSSIGVVQVTIHSAHDLKSTRIGGRPPDPYVSLSINQRSEVARTSRKHSTANPSWGETRFLLVKSFSGSLVLSMLDYNGDYRDSEIGAAEFALYTLREVDKHQGVELPVLKDSEQRGTVRLNISFYPVLKPELYSRELSDTNMGIVRLTLHEAKDLDHEKTITGILSPFVRVHFGLREKFTHTTDKAKHTRNPVWESSTEFWCEDRTATLTVEVLDEREFLNDIVIGNLNVRLEDILNAEAGGDSWWPLSQCKSGKVRLSAEWRSCPEVANSDGI